MRPEVYIVLEILLINCMTLICKLLLLLLTAALFIVLVIFSITIIITLVIVALIFQRLLNVKIHIFLLSEEKILFPTVPKHFH